MNSLPQIALQRSLIGDNKKPPLPWDEAVFVCSIKPSMHEQGNQDDDRDWNAEKPQQ